MTAYPALQPPRPLPRVLRPAGRVALLLCLGLVVVAATWHGWGVRDAAWDYFAPGRHQYDIGRNYYFGTMALRRGVLNLYEEQHANPPSEKYRMNYPTMRTVTFAAWAWWNGEPDRTPHNREPVWEPTLAFNVFLHTFNAVLSLLGAVAAALLVWTWTRTSRGPPLLSAERGWRPWPWIAAAIAFLLYWYNPAGILLAHGWPSPNTWVMPFFLWALLLISWECWFIGGMIIGVGTMFQGQHMLVAPFFVLWPLLAGQPLRAVRWAIGFGFGFTLVLAPGMLTYRTDLTSIERLINWTAVAWLAGGVIGIGAVLILRRRAWMSRLRGAWRYPLAAAIGIAMTALLAWPAMRVASESPALAAGIVLWSAAVAFVVWWWGWRAARYAIPGVLAMQLLLCMPLYNASAGWWHVGFLYGTERHPNLAVGRANNLGSLLHLSYGFRSIEETAFRISPDLFAGSGDEGELWTGGLLQGVRGLTVLAVGDGYNVSMRDFMFAIYMSSLVAAAGAAALQWRRKDPNFLIAATVPWLLFALLPAQMHERYLAFPALGAAVWIGAAAGAGWALLGVFLSLVAYAQITFTMTYYTWHKDRPFFNHDFSVLVQGAHPGIAWALLLAGAIVLYGAFARSRPARQVVPQPAVEMRAKCRDGGLKEEANEDKVSGSTEPATVGGRLD